MTGYVFELHCFVDKYRFLLPFFTGSLILVLQSYIFFSTFVMLSVDKFYKMKQFLEIVARGYMERYPDISRLTFVMPNIRSGSFLMRNLNELSAAPMLSPRIVTISDFINDNIEGVVDSRIDLIFRLYESYCKLQKGNVKMTFEKFSSWGETLLSDFNEVDMHVVDVSEMFKNVVDLNSIKSHFLTDEQKEVMEEYFGYSTLRLEEDLKKFWETFDGNSERDEVESGSHGRKGELRSKYKTLWQMLWPLYKEFKSNLADAGLNTTGGAYREVASKVEKGYEPYRGEKIIFVGFNALSESERRIFKALKSMRVDIGNGRESKADFVWDRVSEVMSRDDDPAQKFIHLNSRADKFPTPDWMQELLQLNVPDRVPEIEVIAVPSNVMQVKVAAEELVKISGSVSEEEIRQARVAIILPDENLLLPLLYSLPEEYPNPNLTMGFPLRQTPVASFARLMGNLQRHSRHESKHDVYFFEDVKDILSHPYSRVLFDGEKINKFISIYENKKRVVVTSEELGSLGDNSVLLFQCLPANEKPVTVLKYINAVFESIYRNINVENAAVMHADVERTYISTYLDALHRLELCMSNYDIVVTPAGMFNLADRLISGETVAFEGEPLEGLQVMGVLETRCLDFDRLIMLSVNEKVMPRVGRNNSFIPNVIRVAYGMPPANYQEEIFAYYFFRVIGRSRKSVLTYDSRTGEGKGAGPSRYLLQMKYLPGEIDMKERETSFGMPSRREYPIRIEKNEDIRARLGRFVKGSPLGEGETAKNFSASALNHYNNCNLKFLFQSVMDLYIEREKIESIDAIDMGSIIHEAIENLYMPGNTNRLLDHPVMMTRDKLEALLDKRTPKGELLIEEAIRKAILRIHFKVREKDLEREKLRGSAAILVENFVEYVKNIIRHDIEKAPFRLWGCEIKGEVELPLCDGRIVKIKMVIDRIDQLGESDPDAPFRVIDYKTGGVHLKIGSLEEAFSDSYTTDYVFQLALYAEMLIKSLREGEKLKLPEGMDLDKFEQTLQLRIYNIPKMTGGKGEEMPEIGGCKIDCFSKFREVERESGLTFLQLLDSRIREILSPEVKFEAEVNDSNCRLCDYRLRCEMLSIKTHPGNAENSTAK